MHRAYRHLCTRRALRASYSGRSPAHAGGPAKRTPTCRLLAQPSAAPAAPRMRSAPGSGRLFVPNGLNPSLCYKLGFKPPPRALLAATSTKVLPFGASEQKEWLHTTIQQHLKLSASDKNRSHLERPTGKGAAETARRAASRDGNEPARRPVESARRAQRNVHKSENASATLGRKSPGPFPNRAAEPNNTLFF